MPSVSRLASETAAGTPGISVLDVAVRRSGAGSQCASGLSQRPQVAGRPFHFTPSSHKAHLRFCEVPPEAFTGRMEKTAVEWDSIVLLERLSYWLARGCELVCSSD